MNRKDPVLCSLWSFLRWILVVVVVLVVPSLRLLSPIYTSGLFFRVRKSFKGLDSVKSLDLGKLVPFISGTTKEIEKGFPRTPVNELTDISPLSPSRSVKLLLICIPDSTVTMGLWDRGTISLPDSPRQLFSIGSI